MNKRNSYTEVPEGYKECLVIDFNNEKSIVLMYCIIVLMVFIPIVLVNLGSFMEHTWLNWVEFVECFVVWWFLSTYIHEFLHFAAIYLTTGYKAKITVKKPYIYHKWIKKDLKKEDPVAITVLTNVYLNRKASVISLLTPFVGLGILIAIILFMLKIHICTICLILLFHTIGCCLDFCMALNLLTKCNKSVITEFSRDMKSYQQSS